MDTKDSFIDGSPEQSDEQVDFEVESEPETRPRQLPPDLPTSLDDRKAPPALRPGVEVYDAWQGQAQYLTSAVPAPSLNFNLSLDTSEDDHLRYQPPTAYGNEARYNRMLAASIAHRHQGPTNIADDAKMAANPKLSEEEKKEGLQSALNMACSNGDGERLQALLSEPLNKYINLNAPDEEGTAPIIYASCFGHENIVRTLLDAGANVDQQDKHKWTSLMWATANRHDQIVKVLLEKGASPDAKSLSGKTAFDFVEHGSEMAEYLHEQGYKIGSAGVVADDFYNSGFSRDQLEEELQESEMKRRMQMDSAINLEVDLGNLGFDEQLEIPDDHDDEEFTWDKCRNDQMFIFQRTELPRILDIAITTMQPQRSHSQKPVPANVIFLCARYAHYHAGDPKLLSDLLTMAMDKINDVVEIYQLDMTVLAFWMSNATLLLHYLRKDAHLVDATPECQLQLTDLINEIFVLIIRDAERRIDKHLDAAILQHETIPGLEDVQFKSDWNLFRSKTKAKEPETMESRFGPPTPQQRAKISPRHITSLLNSTLFVLDLYDVHSLITTQVLAQLYYWLGAELFNRIVTNRKYLARTKAMQIRMNISVLEDWARANNRQPEHYENGSSTSVGETVAEAARHHLAPPIQLLQWLQIFSSFGDSMDELETTIQQLPRLSPQQLIHAVKYYRAEVGEPSLPKIAMKRLQSLQKEVDVRKAQRKSMPASSKDSSNGPTGGLEESTGNNINDEDDVPEHLMLDPALMLPFSLPTSTDMLVSFGAGFGGFNKERARKYIPTLPPEFIQKLDTGNRVNLYENAQLDGEDDDEDENEYRHIAESDDGEEGKSLETGENMHV